MRFFLVDFMNASSQQQVMRYRGLNQCTHTSVSQKKITFSFSSTSFSGAFFCALDNWCLRRILHIHWTWTDFVSNHPMMWFGHIRDNRSCQILSVNGACPSLVICAVTTPVNTTPELSRPAFGVLPKTGDEEREDRGRPGWKRLRMICASSTLVWRRQDRALWIDRHGV